MAKLQKFTLSHNNKSNKWELENDSSDKVVKTFDTKGAATAGGILKKAVGAEGGSVKIKTMGEKYQEERTYPRNRDPKQSKG